MFHDGCEMVKEKRVVGPVDPSKYGSNVKDRVETKGLFEDDIQHVVKLSGHLAQTDKKRLLANNEGLRKSLEKQK